MSKETISDIVIRAMNVQRVHNKTGKKQEELILKKLEGLRKELVAIKEKEELKYLKREALHAIENIIKATKE